MSPSPQRAAGFSRKPAVTKTNRPNDGARALAEARPAPQPIPLKLASILSTYKRHGKLSIRIERLPQLARLSAGRNNGDNSWSLTLDQLEDLTYLPPAGMDEEHVLAIRIIGLDGGGSTLAVLDFPVSPGGAGSETEEEGLAAQDETEEASDNTRPLRAELAKMKASLVARESDLASARQRYEEAETESRKSTGVLMRKGEAGPSKIVLEADVVELRRMHDELAAMHANLSSREAALAEAGLAVEQERERRRESEAALSKAEMDWRAREAARLAAAEAQWEEKFASTLAEACAEAEAARDSINEIEVRRLRGELDLVQASLADCRTALAQASSALEQAHERRRESGAALSKAEAAWRAEEAARLAVAEAQWREASTRALAETRAQHEAALSKAEAAWKGNEATRLTAAEAQWRETSARASAETRAQHEAALSKAETTWKADEAARLAAAETQWRETSARAMAETRAQHETALSKAETTWKTDEAARLAAAEAQWRETSARAMVETRAEHDAALAKAKDAWKADDAARLATAEAKWQEKSAKTSAEMTKRFETAEAALKEARSRGKTAHDSSHEIELRQLREDLAAIQESLSSRESALADAHAALDEARKAWRQESEAALSRAEQIWKADEAARLAATEVQWREKSAATLAEARAKAAADRDSHHEIELCRLREELAAMHTSRSNRGTAATEARQVLEQARQAWRQESEAALSKAEEAWKADEAARLAVAEVQWQETSAKTLAEATKRFEAAESALKQLLIRTEQTRESGNAIEHRRLREELAMMRASLSDREAALAESRFALEQSREPAAPEAKIVLKPDRMGNIVDRREQSERREPEEDRPKSYLIRDMIVVGALAAAAIVFYPRVQSFIPGIPEMGTIFHNAPAPASLPAQVAPRAAEKFTVVVNHGANVRSGPSSTAEIVSALQRGQKVATFEKRGSWTHIRMGGEPGKTESREGWMFSSFLDDPAVGNTASPTAEHK